MSKWIVRAASSVVLAAVTSGCGLNGLTQPSQPDYCPIARADASALVDSIGDEDIKWIGTALRVRQFNGPCACPSDTDENGVECGDRSAYSRSGGEFIACYASDIPDSDIPIIRERAKVVATPIECGGEGRRADIASFRR